MQPLNLLAEKIQRRMGENTVNQSVVGVPFIDLLSTNVASLTTTLSHCCAVGGLLLPVSAMNAVYNASLFYAQH